VRNRRGVILTVHFYSDSRTRIQARVKAGTYYSHQRRAVLRKVWDFKPLPSCATEVEVRAIFEEVPRSILVPVISRTAPVICIDDLRNKKAANHESAKRKIAEVVPLSHAA
jgi:hypothetical protein